MTDTVREWGKRQRKAVYEWAGYIVKGGKQKNKKKKKKKITRATGWGGLLPYDDNDLRKKKKDFFLFYLTFPVSCVWQGAIVIIMSTLCWRRWKMDGKIKVEMSRVQLWHERQKTTTFAHVFWGRHKWNRGERGGEEDSGTLSNKQTFQQKQHEVQQRAKQNKSYKRVRIEWKSIDFDGVPTAP